MQFHYLDEAGCKGGNLSDRQQPVFVLGGLSVSDEKWIKTQECSATRHGAEVVKPR